MFNASIGIDLGTSSVVVYIKGKGILLNEPSIIAYKKEEKSIIAVGQSAYKMLGRNHANIEVVRPLNKGVISSYTLTEAMIKAFLAKTLRSNMISSKLMICVPSGVTDVEQRAVIETARQMNIKEIYIMEEPLAAALGAGLPVSEAIGSMVVDIGGGTSEVAVISLGDIVTSKSCRVAGDNFDEAIISYVKRTFNLLIGERSAEDIKLKLGSAYPYEGEAAMEIKGRNLIDGLPKSVEITSEQVRQALADPVDEILDSIRYTLDRTPPELAADIIERGITLTGGGALLRGLDKLIASETGMPVKVAENPLDCVVNGTGICLEKDLLGFNAR